jgi:hypothetical protein
MAEVNRTDTVSVAQVLKAEYKEKYDPLKQPSAFGSLFAWLGGSNKQVSCTKGDSIYTYNGKSLKAEPKNPSIISPDTNTNFLDTMLWAQPTEECLDTLGN